MLILISQQGNNWGKLAIPETKFPKLVMKDQDTFRIQMDFSLDKNGPLARVHSDIYF